MFIRLLTSDTECVSLNNQTYLLTYILMSIVKNYVTIDECAWSCNILDDWPSRVCVPNIIGDLNLHVFNMIIGINESRTLTKHIPCRCKCKFDSKKCNSNQKWNNDKYR